ncbi:MAG: heparinase II/III family protein, partial [Minisyncoccales bacterium]
MLLKNIIKDKNFIDKLSNYRIKIYKFEIFFSEEHFKWNLSLNTLKLWPKKHWSKLSLYGKNAAGDPRITWELNRLYFFHQLGLSYQMTGDEKYVESIK